MWGELREFRDLIVQDVSQIDKRNTFISFVATWQNKDIFLVSF
ncbi:MAG: hypothetical protein BAJALOKI1v1_550010 [Promethearchaeota archaeon]|nr:MAG: hypothetical protein BAJALOKI1v1_550010 [Candidatus Lokiarchaeota archaeon]